MLDVRSREGQGVMRALTCFAPLAALLVLLALAGLLRFSKT